MAKNWHPHRPTSTVPDIMTLTEGTSSERATTAVGAFLEKVFCEAGWRTLSRDPIDLLFLEKAGKRYALSIKVVREARRNELMAHLADAYLRARVAASKRQHCVPLPVIAAPAISDSMARDLRTYAEEFLDNSAWGLIDGNGRLEFHHLPEAPLRHLRPGSAPKALVRPRTKERVDPFTDLGQWVLKVLLASRIPPGLLSAPREEIRRTDQLAQAAAVSVPHAKRCVRHLQAHGFLSKGRTLQLVRVQDLLDLWVAQSRLPSNDLPTRWLLPIGDSFSQLQQALKRHTAAHLNNAGREATRGGQVDRLWVSGSRACLGMFAAADRLGYGLVSGAAPHLYLEDASPGMLESLGLTAAGPGEAVDVWIRVPRFPESCFRGVLLVDGVPISDILQCWLDVQAHPARGTEQAELLFQRIIKPMLLECRNDGSPNTGE